MDFMAIALEEAHKAGARGEVPVGAVITSAKGEIIARAGNAMLAHNDPTDHAEMRVLRAASEVLGALRLTTCDLYVTLEPCTMCAGAIAHARVRRLYYGAADPKAGAVDSGVQFFTRPSCHHRPEVYGGLREAECSEILRHFFELRRNGQNL